MADEFDGLEKQALDGDRAERLVQDETFQKMLHRVENRYVDQWRASEPGESMKREKAYLLLRALHDLVQEFQIEVDSGKVAKANIQRYRKGRK